MATAAAPRLSQSPDRPVMLVLQIAILIRLLNVSCIRTFFQPDEFFQSLEPAWNLAFGPSGGAWMTWEWKHQLRSSLHPALFSACYIVADFVSSILPVPISFKVSALIAAPRILQALIAAVGDWYTWQLASKIYSNDANAALFALFLQLASPWQWYVSTRTFSNSLETTLTVMALYHWPWQLLHSTAAVKENPKRATLPSAPWGLRASLCLAALAVVLRPTNLLIWAAVLGSTLFNLTRGGLSPVSTSTLAVLVREIVLCGTAVLLISFVSDYFYFGFATFPPYNFLKFNISKALAVFYGRNPWHYYLLQGLPLLTTTSLPFVVQALYKPTGKSADQVNILQSLSFAVFTTIISLSLISHKEVRFIYPLLPILNVLAAPLVASFFSHSGQRSGPSSAATPKLRHKSYLAAALGLNLLLAGFLSFLHQPGPLTVISYLRSEYERIHPASVDLGPTPATAAPPNELFALFLMPCHSTPWRSHLIHANLRAYALTCEPPLHTQPNTLERDNYRDEADRFYDNPAEFLSNELFTAGNKDLPRYIVGFEGIEPWLQQFLQTPHGQTLGMDLKRVWTGFNGFFNEDWRRSGEIMVWDAGVFR
jgi:phosphatidylinositol glycan class B